MGVNILGKGKRKCTCYKLDEELMCYAKGVIGTLSNRQEDDLCGSINTFDAPKDMTERQKEFSKAVKRADKRYDEDKENSLSDWLDVVKEELEGKSMTDDSSDKSKTGQVKGDKKESCDAFLDRVMENIEEGDSCIPDNVIKRFVGCYSSKLRKDEEMDFGPSMKKAWALAKEHEC